MTIDFEFALTVLGLNYIEEGAHYTVKVKNPEKKRLITVVLEEEAECYHKIRDDYFALVDTDGYTITVRLVVE